MEVRPVSFESEYQMVLKQTVGESSFEYVDTDIARMRVVIPGALRTVYRLAGKSPLNQSHNRLFPLESLEADGEGFVAFAEENQSVAIWGYRADEANDNPAVYQKYFDGEEYGPWLAEGQAMEGFLISFAYWSAANGAADFSGVGEVSNTTHGLAHGYPAVWKSPDFLVRGHDTLFVITDDGDFYCFGTNEADVEAMADALQVEWFDMS